MLQTGSSCVRSIREVFICSRRTAHRWAPCRHPGLAEPPHGSSAHRWHLWDTSCSSCPTRPTPSHHPPAERRCHCRWICERSFWVVIDVPVFFVSVSVSLLSSQTFWLGFCWSVGAYSVPQCLFTFKNSHIRRFSFSHTTPPGSSQEIRLYVDFSVQPSMCSLDE